MSNTGSNNLATSPIVERLQREMQFNTVNTQSVSIYRGRTKRSAAEIEQMLVKFVLIEEWCSSDRDIWIRWMVLTAVTYEKGKLTIEVYKSLEDYQEAMRGKDKLYLEN